MHDLGPGVLVFAAALGVYGWRLGVPGPGRDESATVALAGRALPDLAAVIRETDLVHGVYSFLAHVALVLAGPLGWPEITVVRTVSAVAMALSAAMLVPIGGRLGGRAAGVTAGLVLAVSPLASRYAQEAGPWALVTLGTTVAAWTLLRACQMRARNSWVFYAAAIAATAVLDVLSLLVVVAHGGYLLTGPPAVWRRWLLSVAGAVVVLTPFLIATSGQQKQISGRGPVDLAGLDLFFSAQIGSDPRRAPGHHRVHHRGADPASPARMADAQGRRPGGSGPVLGDPAAAAVGGTRWCIRCGTRGTWSSRYRAWRWRSAPWRPRCPCGSLGSRAGWWSSGRALGSAAAAVLIVAMLAGGGRSRSRSGTPQPDIVRTCGRQPRFLANRAQGRWRSTI